VQLSTQSVASLKWCQSSACLHVAMGHTLLAAVDVQVLAFALSA